MTRERYLEMMEQLGKEPIESEIPPSWEDFPEDVISSINIFNLLGDRAYPDIGYIGKDYTNLPILADVYGVNDTEFLMDILNFLDSRAIQKSSESLKKERDKLKRKSSGPK
tara:strand:- start:88 stop:420 length:333 start_codon:yes stop_codon:yes gene_type:complete